MLRFSGHAARLIAAGQKRINIPKTGLVLTAMAGGASLMVEGKNLQVTSASQVRKDVKATPVGEKSRTYRQALQTERNAAPFVNYYLEAYTTETGAENGPGHCSGSVIGLREDGTVELLSHTSFMPLPGTEIFNALTLGLIPIPAENFTADEIRADDVNHAEGIVRIPLTEAGAKRAIAKQNEIAEGVDRGDHTYSVTAGSNAITGWVAALLYGFRLSQVLEREHQAITGQRQLEDPAGLPMTYTADLDMLDRVTAEANMHARETYNCSWAVADVAAAAVDMHIERRVLPVVQQDELLRSIKSAERVKHSLVPVQPEADEGLEFDAPEL